MFVPVDGRCGVVEQAYFCFLANYVLKSLAEFLVIVKFMVKCIVRSGVGSRVKSCFRSFGRVRVCG